MRFNAQSMPRAVRIFILAVAILATLGVSVASASHFDSSPNSCSLCFVAHTVAFETPTVQPVFGPEIVGRAASIPLVAGYRACATRTSSSRGPPSSSL